MRFLLSLFLMLSCHFSQAASASSQEPLQVVLQAIENKKLYQAKQWLKLLHFEKDFFQIRESQVDSPHFFYASNGKKDPQAELFATAQAFFNVSPSDPNEHPQCRFPARYAWLKGQLSDLKIKWPEVSCERFEIFKKGIRGKSVSLVFSSYYLNNPSSAFGHTFLRVNKEPSARDGQRYELLDYGLNYAANPNTKNAILYAFKGLFGMFPGQFNSLPYYFKVREYNNAESRDLWEYELNISPQTVDMITAHVWELGFSQIDYWYLTENCSYHMLSILEAADSNIDILSKLDRFVIPADTVRVLWNETDLVKSFFYRPSVREVFLQRWKGLDSFEKEQVQILANNLTRQDEIVYSEELLARPVDSQARVLDTFIEYIDFRYSVEVQEAGREPQLKLRVLAKRSELTAASEEIRIAPKEELMPHLAHPSGRWGVGGLHNSTNDKDYLKLSHRFALHDRLDPAWGYPTNSVISFFDLDFSYGTSYAQPGENKFELENFSAFEFVSVGPWSSLVPVSSWRLKLGAERTYNENFLPTHEAFFSVGYGLTYARGAFDITAHVVGEAHYGAAHSKNNLWGGAGPLVELHYQVNPLWAWSAQAFYRRDTSWDQKDYLRTQIETQWSFSKEWGLRALYRNQRFLEEAGLQLFNYY